ncbi:D-alanyl-D-alanine carboxypeptidase [Spirulina sp. 06S082]|uniref:D-alanyl-D-alanine carboxypeptidase n=1 Tax=Spirulina sp. 06S082 TaxID=3110248 RepID=UPI002B21D0ED|nr:D-alanyl-D-alanine carboxypeptidase [Spirulina sp. 06S082]MEA5470133.1 D-alanyl-D-alanine carboxypeptidase [Spirulina sp. 06S082]
MYGIVSVLSTLSILSALFGQPEIKTVQTLSWQEAKFFQLPKEPNSEAEEILQQYLRDLASKGFSPQRQGILLQADMTKLAFRNDKVPLSAASLTKIATTLAAVDKWGLDHRFQTRIYRVGEIRNGILHGDLLVEGGGNPFFVWEEAIAIGGFLNRLGIKEVQGNLQITAPFYMNYKTRAEVAGELFRQAIEAESWPEVAKKQYEKMAIEIPRPHVKISGKVLVSPTQPIDSQLLLRHQSMTLANILKQMNIYSNNVMAEVLAESAGGAQAVAQLAANAANVPKDEIQLINGSGLGTDNRISPRAVIAMLAALERQLADQPLGVIDLFPVAGRDRQGTTIGRKLPPNTMFKTGTLRAVSALAGILPTQKQGLVWFVVINEGSDVYELRAQQDIFLRKLGQAWGSAPLNNGKPQTPHKSEVLGDPKRISAP